MRLSSFALVLLLGSGARADEASIGILAVDAHGLSPTEVETLADAIATAAYEMLPGRILGPAEVRELLKEAGAKPAKKCKSKRCWMKVGKAANLNAVLAIRAVANKRGVALSFKWVDVAKKRITARHQQPIRKNVLTFAEDAAAAMKRLREKLEGKIPEPVAPPAPVTAAPAEAAVVAAPTGEVEPPSPEPEPEPPSPQPEPAGEGAVAVASTAAMPAPAPQPPPRATATARSAAKVWLGLGLGRGSPGAVVRRVASGGPGEAARLQPGDVIQAWDGWVITTARDVMGFALRTGPGRTARIKVSRGGAEKMLSITPEELSDGAEEDAYEVTDVTGPPSTMQARPADSAPRGWPPPGAQQGTGSSSRRGGNKGFNKKRK